MMDATYELTLFMRFFMIIKYFNVKEENIVSPLLYHICYLFTIRQ